MAITSAYATATQYRTVFGETTSTLTTEIDEVLAAASRYLDEALGRTFNQDTAVVTFNVVTGSKKSDQLEIPDVSTKTGFVVKVDEDGDGDLTDETALTIDEDFYLRGEDFGFNPDTGPEARPWVDLWIPPWGSPQLSYFPTRTLVQLTYKRGWAAVPAAIKHGTIQLAGIYLLKSPRATQRMQEGFDAVIGTSRDAQRIVHTLMSHYRRRWSF